MTEKSIQTESPHPNGNDHPTKTQGQLLLEMIAISGEYPAENIHRLIPATSYAKKVVSALSSNNLIKTVYSGGLRGYRLTIKGKRKLAAENHARYDGLWEGNSETNRKRAGHTRRLRVHSVAQVYTLMHNANVHIFQDTKPMIFTPLQMPLSQTDNVITSPCFYSSREQKGDDDQSNAIRGSRATGALTTPTHLYAVYNTGNTHIGWWEKLEQRYKVAIQSTILRTIGFNQHNSGDVSGIMIGEGLEPLEKYWAAKRREASSLSFLAHTFNSFYYVTNDAFGETQLKLLCSNAKMIALKKTLSKGLLPHDNKYPIEHDALAEDGTPVLFCCLLDIPRLLRFHNGLSLHGKAGKVIAFDFQHEVLGRYLGDKVEFVLLSFEKFVKNFFPKE